jgi:hypothetical protein
MFVYPPKIFPDSLDLTKVRVGCLPEQLYLNCLPLKFSFLPEYNSSSPFAFSINLISSPYFTSFLIMVDSKGLDLNFISLIVNIIGIIAL